jgi:diaminopimelate epimerase
MHFFKYQGTGNDFVMIDDRNNRFNVNDTGLVKHLCDRRFGIGADGLILLRLSPETDFEMVYFNSDGNLSSMCGNGGRCIARFAQELGIIKNEALFNAVDGLHTATLDDTEVSLKMVDVVEVIRKDDSYFLNTGSPHVVKYITSPLSQWNVFEEGRKIRYSDRFKDGGTNVNFVVFENDVLNIRTYERGVEDETLSCGTGITASALAHAVHSKLSAGDHTVPLQSMGGPLRVSFHYDGHQSFTNILLIGPAEKSFEGDV